MIFFNLQIKLLENKTKYLKKTCQIARIHVRIDLFVGPNLGSGPQTKQTKQSMQRINHINKQQITHECETLH